jgi:HSP90 family molecular chaperone
MDFSNTLSAIGEDWSATLTEFLSEVKHWDEYTLSVGGPEVLKLFVEPPYGSRPEYGVRELIQNSVDAVRERRAMEGETSSTGDSPEPVLRLQENQGS